MKHQELASSVISFQFGHFFLQGRLLEQTKISCYLNLLNMSYSFGKAFTFTFWVKCLSFMKISQQIGRNVLFHSLLSCTYMTSLHHSMVRVYAFVQRLLKHFRRSHSCLSKNECFDHQQLFILLFTFSSFIGRVLKLIMRKCHSSLCSKSCRVCVFQPG